MAIGTSGTGLPSRSKARAEEKISGFFAANSTAEALVKTISSPEVTASPATVHVLFHPDGHRAVFDNTRVLHARTGFAGAGRRHLQGCYADLDGIESAVAVGERATTDDTRRKDRI